MTVGPERWIAPASHELLWLEDQDRAVVYDRRSRQTHVLNATAAAALKLLMDPPQDAPLDAADLGRGLAALDPPGGGPDEGAVRELAVEILRTFDELGLIEPAVP